MYRVAIVSEGPADREVVQAVLDAHLDDYEPVSVQPPLGLLGGDSGPLGGGWRGVKAWCEQESHAADDFKPLMANADLLIIQIDADVALEDDHDPTLACPPPKIRSDSVRALVQAWLGRSDLPDAVLLCVPAMATETWALVALYPGNGAIVACTPQGPPDCIECRLDIKQLLRSASKRRRPKMVTSADGHLKNHAKGFAAAAAEITAGWASAVGVCSQAARFDADLRGVLP